MNIQMSCDYYATSLPNAFIDNYMDKANPVFTLVYIYGLRKCMSGSGDLTTSELATRLNILETDVVNAWKYWEQQELIKINAPESGQGEVTVSYLPVPAVPQTAKPAEKPAEVKTVVISERPSYTVEELEIYKNQYEEIGELFAAAESSKGNLLKYHELNMLFGLYDWLRMPVKLIRFLLEYCSEHDRWNLRYIETTAVDWAENGIDTVDKAREYVQSFGGDYRKILQALGGAGRLPSPTQRKHMDRWLYDFKMPIEIILEACDRAAVQIGKPKLAYVDGILADWDKKNIRDMESVKRDAEEFNSKREPAAKEAAKTPARKNRFVNFPQRDTDFRKIEELEMEYLKKSLKG